MVLGDVLGEFVAGELVCGDDPGDGADLFENRQVSIDARLGQCLVRGEDLGDGQGSVASLKGRNQPSTAAGVALIGVAQQGGDVVVDFVCGHLFHAI